MRPAKVSRGRSNRRLHPRSLFSSLTLYKNLLAAFCLFFWLSQPCNYTFIFCCRSPVVILHCPGNVCTSLSLYFVSCLWCRSSLLPSDPCFDPPVRSLISSFERDTKIPASSGSAGPEDLTPPSLPPLLTLQFLPASMLPSDSLSFPLSSWLCGNSRGCSCSVVIKIYPPLCFSLCFSFLFSSVRRCSWVLISALKLYERQGCLCS